mmetsp:Transcript_83125/g.267906  ORF Transcript_83125/g.267906 Transcript_83125/m.267906 type:complete len:201 (-) Transcript_83125:2129-2731(-)
MAVASCGVRAETMMIGIFVCISNTLRILSHTSKPVMPGIWMSSNTKSGILPCWPLAFFSAWASRYAKASWPHIATSMSHKSWSALWITSWFTSSSSTERIKGRSSGMNSFALAGFPAAPAAEPGVAAGAARASGAWGLIMGPVCWMALPSMGVIFPWPKVPSQKSWTTNFEPRPSSDSTRMHPPCISAISVQTESPSPMP